MLPIFNIVIAFGCSLVSNLKSITALLILSVLLIINVLVTIKWRANETVFQMHLNLSIFFGFILIICLSLHFSSELLICTMHGE